MKTGEFTSDQCLKISSNAYDDTYYIFYDRVPFSFDIEKFSFVINKLREFNEKKLSHMDVVSMILSSIVIQHQLTIDRVHDAEYFSDKLEELILRQQTAVTTAQVIVATEDQLDVIETLEEKRII